MSRTKFVLALLAALLTACSSSSAREAAPAATSMGAVRQASATPTAQQVPTVKTVVKVLGLKLVRPKPAAKTGQRTTYSRTLPASGSPYTKDGRLICYVGNPCDLSKAHWTITYGCTGAWRRAMHTTHCPPGNRYLP